MSRPAELLAPNRQLLFPRFETYRLHSIDPDTDLQAFKLPGDGATQSRVGYGEQQLGFKEVRARIAWDHLDTAGSRGAYVDKDWNVVAFELDVSPERTRSADQQDTLAPRFAQVASLPTPISSGHAEYPRALPLSQTAWAVSTGSGSLYVLRVSEPGSELAGEFIARYDLVLEGGQTPFILYAAHHEGGDAFRLLLARAVVEPMSDSSKYTPRVANFELVEVGIDISHSNGVDDSPELLQPQWALTGGDLPYWASWTEGGWLVLCEEPFGEKQQEEEKKPETAAQRAQRLREAKLAKLGLGANIASRDPFEQDDGYGEAVDQEADEEAMDVDTPKEYPFRWTQDTTSVTITVPLPAGTTSKDINVKITPDMLGISIQSDSLTPALSSFVSKPAHSFWNGIVVDESTWTYDATKAELDIELQKQGEDGMRWPSVFVPSSDDEDDAEDVPETFAASTLDAIRKSFSSVQTRTSEEPHGNQPAIPALLREEMDFDLDDGADYGEGEDGAFAHPSGASTVGRTVLFGHIVPNAEGGVPTVSWPRQPAQVLSLPVTSQGPELPSAAGVIVKTAVDGLVFAPSTDPARAPWVHLGTNPALAFVMSSKRDLRLVRHVTRASRTAGGSDSTTSQERQATGDTATTVFALESGTGVGNGNAYIYYPPPTGGDGTAALQGVVSVSGGDRGALLGVGSVRVPGRDEDVVVALCEHALVVLGGVF